MKVYFVTCDVTKVSLVLVAEMEKVILKDFSVKLDVISHGLIGSTCLKRFSCCLFSRSEAFK